MKRNIPTLALAASVVLIGLGAYGVMSSRDADAATMSEPGIGERDSRGGSDVGKATAAYGAKHYEGLDMVRISGDQPSQEKDYEGFRLSFNHKNHTPNWVAWELLGGETSGDAKRSNKFWRDDEIYGCPETSDYTRSGYDRGHMCPAADQKWSSQAMSDCFVMTNMCPQDHSLNSGAWNTLENKERVWAQRDSAVMIVAGPIYDKSDTQTIGEIGVRVPGAFFKVLLAPYVDEPRGIAFIYPNMSSPGDMAQYVTTIDEVEKLTGFDFFYNLPDEIENAVEASSSFKEWNRKRRP